MALNSRIQTYQILTNDDEVCIPSISSILIAVSNLGKFPAKIKLSDGFCHSLFNISLPVAPQISGLLSQSL